MVTAYPIIANCNYESADDTTIHTIRKAVDAGLTENANLIEALDSLEETLTEHAESDSEVSVKACHNAEAAVLAAWTDEIIDAVEAARIAGYRS